jgi:2-keto-4-pentenoate hydratase/2-oxohepta-3-ene-1,7-dioic acid hydratase in catechol pathway
MRVDESISMLETQQVRNVKGFGMRVGNLNGRAVLILDAGAIDVAEASDGRFGPSISACYHDWDAFVGWANSASQMTDRAKPYESADLQSPSPTPLQSFGIGMNYAGHAAEVGVPNPEYPPTFTKFPSCITGPYATVTLPSDGIDWEVELVVVIGRTAHNVAEAEAWSHIAGLTIGQDLSNRAVQLRPPVPQFSLGKSFPGFGPMGPWLVTPDEFDNPDDLALSCTIDGEVMQSSRTNDLIFSVPAIIEQLSAIVTLVPGDVIFTGTPAGVGAARKPPRFLRPGEVLVSTIEGIGSITTNFVGA